MNRLVIIGNGFDLAHGLPTSYKDFIDDYWSDIADSDHNDGLVEFVLKLRIEFESSKNLNGLAKKVMAYDDKIKFSDAEIYREYGNNYNANGKYQREQILIYKNDFFKLINQKNIENWVDIENLYYSELKKIVNSKSLDVTKTAEFWKKEQLKSMKKLNEEFLQIEKLLEQYLIEKIENQFELKNKIQGDNSWTNFYHILKPISIFNNEEKLELEFNQVKDKNSIDEFFKLEKRDIDNNKAKSLLISFNYTSTLDKYIDSFKEGVIDVVLNQIHGRINSDSNKINFGFGDEMDDDYKIIENINENEYLKNFKSFHYLQNSNYSNLLSFIESEKFQVLILGHSCGLSDRTLLNTIFEHINCRSIKIYYHQKEDGSDNYTEIVQNISRHFNKKKLMREKIVNKTLCKPLPQIQLPKKH